LYEELLYDVNSAEKTSNKKIFVTKLRDEGIKIEDFLMELQELIINKKFKNIKECLKKYVSTYKEADYN
jgi:FlaA1/EpsC-like NDP-sugar epimerase